MREVFRRNFGFRRARYFCALFVCVLLAPSFLPAETIAIDSGDARWIANMIFKNECNLRAEYLTTWNEGENFPSLGIGHFIWYPKDQTGPFQESFPEFIRYLKSSGYIIPEWLDEMLQEGMPWKNREAFLADQTGEAMIGMRQFLIETMEAQALFIFHRFKGAIRQMADTVSDERRAEFIEKIFELTRTRNGIYAMIDYTNFKGDGLADTERYHTHGWGLFQVLQTMNWPLKEKSAEEEFVAAAKKVLRQRVDNAPSERAEERWIQGWEKRVATYSSETSIFDPDPRQHVPTAFFEKKDTIEVFNLAELTV